MASGEQNRGLDEIIAFGTKFESFCQEIRVISSRLKADADNAGSVLKDEISKDNIRSIQELAEQLRKSVDQGEEPVLELVRKAKKEKSDLEELKGMSR